MDIKVKCKRLNPRAVLPQAQTQGSAGCDLSACLEEPAVLEPGGVLMTPLGFAAEIPEGMAGLVLSRSGLGARQGIVVAQGVGVIDSDYRGEWSCPAAKEARGALAAQGAEPARKPRDAVF